MKLNFPQKADRHQEFIFTNLLKEISFKLRKWFSFVNQGEASIFEIKIQYTGGKK